MPDDTTQSSLYTITADEQMRVIRERRVMRDRVDRALAENFAERKALRSQRAKASADLETAIGGELQTGIAMESLLLPDAGEINTNATIKSKRKEMAWQHVVAALKAGGGRLSNLQLSSLVGVSPHGLAGILDGCPFVAKRHDGRVGNEVTYWEIVE